MSDERASADGAVDGVGQWPMVQDPAAGPAALRALWATVADS